MGIVGGLLWIVIGIVYVVYRLYKEDKPRTISDLKAISIVIIPSLIAAFIIEVFGANIFTTIIGISLIILKIPLFLVYLYTETKKKDEISEETDLQYQFRLESLQDKEIGKLLGCPLNLIPLNPNKHKNDADSQRRGLAIKEIMRENNRIYSYQFRPWMSDLTNYPQEFLAFVNEYKSSQNND